jgi:ATP-dependent Clp protease ATP-binding subunit ClpA
VIIMRGVFMEKQDKELKGSTGNKSGIIKKIKAFLFGEKYQAEKIENHIRKALPKQPSVRLYQKELITYGINLNDRAMAGFIDNVIGRDKEIERVIQILNRRIKNNPILIGEPGVGKTSIVEGLALRIVSNNVPLKLSNKIIYFLDLPAVIAGTHLRGQFEGRMKAIIDEVRAVQNVILFIDEIHNIVGAGKVEDGPMDAANILKPALARGDIQIIGATTLEDYRKYIEKDSALERRFQPVMVNEPTIAESIEILRGVRQYYEDFHNVYYPEEVLETAVKMSSRYINDRFLPDKAIDIIDEAGSRVNIKSHNSLKLEDIRNELKKVQNLKEQAALTDDYKRAFEYREKEKYLKDRINEIKNFTRIEVTPEDIASVVESWTGIPVQRVTESEAAKLLNIEDRLHRRVIGQDRGVASLARAVRRTRSDLRRRKRPCSFIFAGPTGVGKTELARALAYELFGNEDAIIKLDMSEFMEKHSVSKLIGAPPGYIGYDQSGTITERVRRKPYSVLLLDEIEKAHPDVFNMLLQIMEDGRLTDSKGRVISFENTIIIMTSNAGTSERMNGIGFNNQGYEALEKKVKNAIKETFRPEFLNRVDEIIVFEELSRAQLREIVEIMLKQVTEDLKEKNINIIFDDRAKEILIEKGYDAKYGARPLRKTIQRYIEDELSELFLLGKLAKGSTVHVTTEKEQKIVINVSQTEQLSKWYTTVINSS